jgi:hydroxypyruvate isomerase
MLKFDPNLRWLFTELPMPERYAAAAAAGFKGVEVAFPYETPAADMAARLRDNDLTLVQILSPFDWDGGERGIGGLPGRKADFRASIKTAVDYAAQVGRPLIHVMPGNLNSDLDPARCLDIFHENIAWAADYAKTEQITLILEPCCSARFPDFLYHRLEEGIAVIDQVGRDNIRLCFDTFHVQMEEGSITTRLQTAFPYIGHMQVGNVPGRHEPGTGEIYFPYLFAQIEKLGWKGWIGCEYTPSGPTLETLGWGAPYGIGTGAGVTPAA